MNDETRDAVARIAIGMKLEVEKLESLHAKHAGTMHEPIIASILHMLRACVDLLSMAVRP
jgi:hypothetical protein